MAEDTPAEAPAVPSDAVEIDYTNFRGERGVRTIIPTGRMIQDETYHPGVPWLIEARDVEKNAVRTFDPAKIHRWGKEAPPAPAVPSDEPERYVSDEESKGQAGVLPPLPKHAPPTPSEDFAGLVRDLVVRAMDEYAAHETEEAFNQAAAKRDETQSAILAHVDRLEEKIEWLTNELSKHETLPSEHFATLVQAYGAAVSGGSNWEGYKQLNEAALLAHGARLEGEIERLTKELREERGNVANLEDKLFFQRHGGVEKERDAALQEIERLRSELAQRDAALAQAPTAGPQSVPEEVRALIIEQCAQKADAAARHDAELRDKGVVDKAHATLCIITSRAIAKEIRSLLAQQTPGDAP